MSSSRFWPRRRLSGLMISIMLIAPLLNIQSFKDVFISLIRSVNQGFREQSFLSDLLPFLSVTLVYGIAVVLLYWWLLKPYNLRMNDSDKQLSIERWVLGPLLVLYFFYNIYSNFERYFISFETTTGSVINIFKSIYNFTLPFQWIWQVFPIIFFALIRFFGSDGDKMFNSGKSSAEEH